MSEQSNTKRIEILDRWTGAVLYSCEAATIADAVQRAVGERVRLDGANLVGASLVGASLVGASLARANLARANLARANLVGANLARANLVGASLVGASLVGASLVDANLARANLARANLDSARIVRARIGWQSHDVISALLLRAAGNDLERRSLAGLIFVSRDWCWDVWLGRPEAAAERSGEGARTAAIRLREHPLREWALDTLAAYVTDGDDAPGELRARAKRIADVAQPGAADGTPDGTVQP